MDGHDLDLPLGQETYSFGLSLATGKIQLFIILSHYLWLINNIVKNLSKANGSASQMFQQIENAKSKKLTENRLS